eukprot:5947904-Prymnesium_polylepis.1
MYIPPPCKGIDAFRSFTALHWGDGLLRNGSRIYAVYSGHSVATDDAVLSMQSALIDEDSTTLQPAKLDFETQENNSIGAMEEG